MSTFATRPIVPNVVSQHVEDAASLRSTRSVLVRAPHVRLLHLGRADDRLRAHLDGISVAGDAGYRMAQIALELPGVGQLFTVAVAAVERRDLDQLQRLAMLADKVPETRRALASAYGWVSAPALRGLTAPLLAAADATLRWFGVAACAAHRVDPGTILDAALSDGDAPLRARALRAAGELGRGDLLDECIAHAVSDADAACRYQAAWSARLLGERSRADPVLREIALQNSPDAHDALQLALLGADLDSARALVRELGADGSAPRATIRAAGWAGDVHVVPWLIQQMADDRHARLAGESFTLLTGADLARFDLERKPPAAAVGERSEEPSDADVSLDEDDSLPWPDVARVQAWWDANARHMPLRAVRCFMGMAAEPAHCAHVLREGAQRQRRCAALLLALLRPKSGLFNFAAPAWRQERLLSAGPT